MNKRNLILGVVLAFVLAGQSLHAAVPEFDPTKPFTIVEDPADRARLDDLRAKARKGDTKAQFELGGAIRFGHFGVVKNEVEAVDWYRKAAEQNYAEAQSELGACYAHGWGVAKNEMEAVKWYRKAANLNHAEAQYELGVCYAEGDGVAKDAVEALKWFRKAAESEPAFFFSASAQIHLGLSYAHGQGVAKDEVEAVRWYRKAASQGLSRAIDVYAAQYNLGICYAKGEGVARDEVEAVKWYRKAAENDYISAQFNLGRCYAHGQGVVKDEVEAVKWYRKAADKGDANGQINLGKLYLDGKGVKKDAAEAAKWFCKAAERGDAHGQYNLGHCYANGNGVTTDYVRAYQWFNLASAQGEEAGKIALAIVAKEMTGEQIAEAQKLARDFKPRTASAIGGDGSSKGLAQTRPTSSGTGFFITEDGYFITNEHVAGNGAEVRLVTAFGLISAKVVKVDAANDLALLKAEGRFAALPVAASRGVKLGGTVATVGFPNIGLQGFAPKLAKGEVASLSGAGDDARYFQISVPVQPGNSGGALVDERGNVVGVVAAKLSARAALAASGALPENVNYAVKSSYLLGFLESMPDVAAKFKEPETKERKFEEVVKSAERAAVLVLVY